MKSSLLDLATIYSGVYATPKPDGVIYYMQARNIRHDHQFIEGLTPELVDDGKIGKHFLQEGDILVAAKGREHYAIEYKGYPRPAVASTIFLVLRVKNKDKLLPSFLRWYINLPSVQKNLAGGAQGSALPVISKSELENLDISIPSLENQFAIIKIDELLQREAQLKSQIEILKTKKIEQELLNVISK